MYKYILSHFAGHLKPTQLHKAILFQKKKKKEIEHFLKLLVDTWTMVQKMDSRRELEVINLSEKSLILGSSPPRDSDSSIGVEPRDLQVL